MRERKPVVPLEKQRLRGRIPTRGIPYPYIRDPKTKALIRVLPYKEKSEYKSCRPHRVVHVKWKLRRLIEIVKKLGPDEFLFFRRIDRDHRKHLESEYGLEFHPWYQEDQQGFLAFHKGAEGIFSVRKVQVGKEGSVQEICGLPDFCQAVPRRAGIHRVAEHGAGEEAEGNGTVEDN